MFKGLRLLGEKYLDIMTRIGGQFCVLMIYLSKVRDLRFC